MNISNNERQGNLLKVKFALVVKHEELLENMESLLLDFSSIFQSSSNALLDELDFYEKSFMLFDRALILIRSRIDTVDELIRIQEHRE